MQINLEQAEKHSVQAYTAEQIKVNEIWYSQNILVNSRFLISDWTRKNICSLQIEDLQPVLEWKAEIIIIGHRETGVFPSSALINEAAKIGIGLESMSVEAACRTYNVLLGEHRNVVLAIL